MRFMMFMILPTDHISETGGLPPPETFAEMDKFNKQLEDAGALIGLEGLHATSKGARISLAGGKPLVTDGPFAEAKEVIGGYWMIQAASLDEAIAWAKRVPGGEGVVEIRQLFEPSDFPPDIQQATV